MVRDRRRPPEPGP